jgi:hypothetical membrane protein
MAAVKARDTYRRLDRALALGGIIGPLVFVATFTFAGLMRPGYSPVDQAISDLGIDDNAWMLNVSLIVLGLLLIGLAVALYRTVRPESSAGFRFVASLFVGMVGLGYSVAGIFPETVPIHWLVGATLIYLGAPVGFLLAGLLLVGGDRSWRPLGVYSLLASLATVVMVGLTFYVFLQYTFTPGSAPVGQFGGLTERLLFVEILAWYVAIGWRLAREPRHPPSATVPRQTR